MPRSESSKVLTIRDGSPPVQIAGRVRTPIRLLIQPRSCLISSAGHSPCTSISHRRGAYLNLRGPPFAELSQELLWRDKKRILLKDAADDDHRMCPKDVNHGVPTKLAKIIRADDSVLMAVPQVVHTRLELHDFVCIRSSLDDPIHAAHDPAERESSLG